MLFVAGFSAVFTSYGALFGSLGSLLIETSSGNAGRGAALSFAYAAGLGVPFILVAAGMQRFLRTVGWARRHARTITRIGGALLIVLGPLQVTGMWTMLIARMQGLIAGWQVPL